MADDKKNNPSSVDNPLQDDKDDNEYYLNERRLTPLGKAMLVTVPKISVSISPIMKNLSPLIPLITSMSRSLSPLVDSMDRMFYERPSGDNIALAESSVVRRLPETASHKEKNIVDMKPINTRGNGKIEISIINSDAGAQTPISPEKWESIASKEDIKESPLMKEPIASFTTLDSNTQQTLIPVNVPASLWAGKTAKVAFKNLEGEFAEEIIAYILVEKMKHAKTEAGSLFYPDDGEYKENSVYVKKINTLLEKANGLYLLTFNE